MKFFNAALSLFVGMVIFAAQPMAKESPMSIEGATAVNASEAKALFDKGVKFIDVRKDSDWDAGRIPGAVHIELKKKLSTETLGKSVGKDQEVVIYCNGAKCLRAAKGCTKAVAWGFSKVHYFRDGFPGWSKAGFPVE
jgi:rhodanese-related sulfurtransferase